MIAPHCSSRVRPLKPWVRNAGRGLRNWAAALGAIAGLLAAPAAVSATPQPPNAADTPLAALPRSTPEAQGVKSSAILALVRAFEEEIDAVHSLMILRHGQVIAEGWWDPYVADDPHILYSLTKSFTSSAVGFAAQEGRLHVNDTVLSHFPKLAPARPSENMRKMRIRDLLRMASGHDGDIMAQMRANSNSDWVKTFLHSEIPHRPGTHFRYNSGASYVLAAIVQKVSGQTVEQYLRPRLFDPLGMGTSRWGLSAEGINLGAGGLQLRTEAIANFGQLYLQRGVWNGRRVLSPSWVAAATSLQISTGSDPESNWDSGYGYQFWRNKVHGYRADGAQGQFSLVLPYYDTVVAITSGTSDMAGVMDAVWQHLLPSLLPNPLPADSAAYGALQNKLTALALPVQVGPNSTPMLRKLAGRNYLFKKNDQGIETVKLEMDGEHITLAIRDADGEHRIACGFGQWRRGRTGFKKRISSLMDVPEQGIAASCAWTRPNVLSARLCFNETPYTIQTRLEFSGSQLLIDMEHNLRWGETKRKRLTGTRQ